MGRTIRSKTIMTGRNAEHPTYRDDKYIRCKHCNFICHLDRDSHAPRGSKRGDGISHAGIIAYDEDTVTYDGTDDDYDATVSYDGYRSQFTIDSGCPFCGCLLYYE